MWRLFTSHIDAVPDTANDIDRNDWSICRTIYTTLRPFEQSLILARYRSGRYDNGAAFTSCCDAAGISEASAITIMASIMTRTAEDRGLIGKRDNRSRPYRMDGRKAEGV